MKQASLKLNLASKKTRKKVFLDQMEKLFHGLRWSNSSRQGFSSGSAG
jgi:hypothetical protein